MQKEVKTRVAKTRDNKLVSWKHPGGKFLRLGPESCTDGELLAILMGAGAPGRTAEQIVKDLLLRYQSFKGLTNQPLETIMKIKGLKKVKAIRIATAFEIARRIVKEVIKKND